MNQEISFEINEEVNEELFIPAFAKEGLEDFAPSMEVQAAEIKDVFYEMPDLQPENWKNLDINERVEALQALEKEVARIEHRDPQIVGAEQLDPRIGGYHVGNRIVINECALADDSRYAQALQTFFHEGRHAYQNYNLEVKQVEQNDEWVQAWRDNMEKLGYESGNWEVLREVGFLRYKTQPVEVDARAFANVMMRTLNL